MSEEAFEYRRDFFYGIDNSDDVDPGAGTRLARRRRRRLTPWDIDQGCRPVTDCIGQAAPGAWTEPITYAQADRFYTGKRNGDLVYFFITPSGEIERLVEQEFLGHVFDRVYDHDASRDAALIANAKPQSTS